MFQNIKVDIIYYKSNTDFELEFNLCGCCRMRLLTDKSSDKKSLVHSLARAVSRSRVIIIAGSLFGEDGIISIVSSAIGKTLSEIDNKLYGISGGDKISVINGSTPLVTSEGYFGGCIIESGPQSMILLSDNKTVRKSIMNTLIHPYIEELCAIDLKAKAANSAAAVQAVPPAVIPDKTVSETLENTEEPSSSDISGNNDTDSVNDESADTLPQEETPQDNPTDETEKQETEESKSVFETQEEDNEDGRQQESTETENKSLNSFAAAADDGVILSGGMIFETDDYRAQAESYASDENADLYVEPEKLKKGRVDYYNEQYALTTDGEEYYHTGQDEKERPKPIGSGNLPILILSIILLVILAVLCYCIFYVPAKDGVSAAAYLQETFNTLFGQ